MTTKTTAPSEAERAIARDYKDIRQDYQFEGGPFSQEPDRVAKTKWIIEHKLTEVDRTLIILYVDCHSYRKLGKRLGLSHTLVGKEIRRIRAHILAEYEKIKDTDIA